MNATETTPKTWGRYRELERVTVGGMATTSLARCLDTDRLVIIKEARPGEHNTRALRHEANVLRKLSCPQIAALLDADLVDTERPWLVLDYIRGDELHTQTTRQSAASPRAIPPSMCTLFDVSLIEPNEVSAPLASPRTKPRVYDHCHRMARVFASLCGALAGLHGERWVHGDLSPRNAIVGVGERVTLIDLGLAVCFGDRIEDDQLERAGRLAGTAPYISPEQIRGDALDARADLYSLGCLLYEHLTRHPPFVGDTSEVLHAHLTQRPLRPSAQVEGVPAALDALVMQLLSKDPRRRPPHVLVILNVMHRTGWLLDHPDAFTRHAQPYLLLADDLGRGAELDAFDAAIAEGRVRWHVSGDVGLGKSRLAFEFVQRARASGWRVLTASAARPGHVLDPFLQWCDAAHATRDARAGHILDLWRAPSAPGARDLIRLQDALIEVLELRGETPTLLVIDDAHHLSELADSLIQRLMRALPSMNVVLVARDTRLAELCEETWSLAQLTTPEQRKLVTQLLGGARPPEVLLEFLEHTCAGAPLSIYEYMRLILSRRLLWMNAQGHWSCTPHLDELREELARLGAPRALFRVYAARLGHLGEDAMRVCLAIAVADQPLNIGHITTLLGEDPIHAMHQLERAALLTHHDGVWWFTHDAFAQVTLSNASADDIHTLHESTTRAHDAGIQELPAHQLARHLEALGDHRRACSCWLEAGHEAVERHDLSTSVRAFERALSLTESPEEHVALELDIIELVLLPRGQYEGVAAKLGELGRTLGDDSPLALSIRHLRLSAVMAHLSRRHDDALVLLDQLDVMILEDDALERARALKLRADIYDLIHRSEEAADLYHQAITAIETRDHPRLTGDMWHNRALAQKRMRRFDDALADLERASTLYAAHDIGERVVLARQTRIGILRMAGRVAEALDLARVANEKDEAQGSYAKAASQRYNLSHCLTLAGDMHDAEVLLDGLAAWSMSRMRDMTRGLVHTLLGHLHVHRAQWDEAKRHLWQAADHLKREQRRPRLHSNQALCLAMFANVELLTGRPELALGLLDRTRQVWNDTLDLHAHLMLSSIELVAAALLGDQERAHSVMEGITHLSNNPSLVLVNAYRPALAELLGCLMDPTHVLGLEALGDARGRFDHQGCALMVARMDALLALAHVQRLDLLAAHRALTRAYNYHERHHLTLDRYVLCELDAHITRIQGLPMYQLDEELEELREALGEEMRWLTKLLERAFTT